MAKALMTALMGLALFLFGISLLTSGLREWGGSRLRERMRRASRHRLGALSTGIALGALVQTSAGSVLTAGFVHAGLMTLAQTLPLILGMNVGTTLAVQVMAFRVTEYAALLLAAGVLLYLGSEAGPRRALGAAGVGLGLLFAGLAMMSEPMRPHREALAHWLAHFDGGTTIGLLTGTLASVVVTAVVQSSSAVLGVTLALVHAGVITRFELAYPVIIGANLGTCVTGLLGTLGMRREARRVAFAHLLFNVWGGFVGVLLAPLFYRYIGHLTSDLPRQIAHANTLKMIASVALLWPWQLAFVHLLRRVVPERSGDAEEDAVSHLDEELLTRPEDALRAVIAELRRAVGLCVRSHGCATHLILERQPALIRRVMRNEEAMDELKAAIRDYLTRLTRRYLSRRQAILLQYLDRVAWNVERIHDHLTVIVDLSVRRYREPEACYQVDDLDRLMDLHDHVGEILERLQQSLDPDAIDYYEGGQRVLSAANAFMMRSAETQRVFTDRIGRHVYPSLSGLFYSEYVFTYDRIAIHARRIAETECESDFWIKQSKLGRVEPPVPPYTPPERVSVRAYLEARRNRRETPWTPTPTAGAGGRPMAGGRRHGFSGAAGEINGAEGDE